MDTKKVIVYVDGYNFYYGLKNGGAKWKRHYWLDIVKFFERMMLPNQELVDDNGICPFRHIIISTFDFGGMLK